MNGELWVSLDGGLTPRETEIAVLVAEGLSNKEIGVRLGISDHTVGNMLVAIFIKLEIHSRVQLARHAFRLRLIEP